MNAQQLRNSILQQAIQGKLVAQNPADEPASVLLQRIRKEKERLVKEGKLKKKDLESKPIEEDEIPFEIPKGWAFCRLGDVGIFERGNGIKRDETTSSGYPCVRYGEMYTKYRMSPTFSKTYSYTTFEVFKKCKKAYNGDLFMALTGENKQDISLAAQYVGKEEVAVGGDLCHFTIIEAFALYFVYLINSKYFSNKKELLATGDIIVHISTDKLASIPIPLPPLAEQRRIVAKIEELMPLVERYGKAQHALDQLNESLPARLRQSILQEAIQGRLVPQDPKEEPASELLKRIRKEKEQLVKEGKLKKKDLESKSIEEDEIPFEVPEGWEYVRLGELVYNQTGLSYSKGDLEKKVSNPIRVLRGGNIQNGSWCIKGDDVMIAPEFVKKPNLSLQKNTFITPAVTSLEHLGKTALIEEDHNDIVAGGFVLYLIPYYRQEDTYIKYLSYFFQTLFYNKFCKSIANKSGQAFWNLSRQKLMELTIPLPPLSEQKRIVAKVEELFGVLGKLSDAKYCK